MDKVEIVILVALILILAWLVIPQKKINRFFGERTSPEKKVRYIGIICGGLILLFQLSEIVKQNSISDRGQINTRFKDASTLLGNDQTASILSGIYALHQIALEASKGSKEQQGYVKIIHEILCAYVRESVMELENDKASPTYDSTICEARIRICTRPKIIIQTILDILFEKEKNIYTRYNSDLKGAVLDGIDFRDLVLTYVDLNETTIKNIKFYTTSFEKVYFYRANLRNVDFLDSKLMGVNFMEAKFEKVVFSNTDIIGKSKIAIIMGNFLKTTMEDVYFLSSNLLDISFTGSNLTNVIFNYSILTNVNYINTELTNVGYSGSKLTNVGFESATYTGGKMFDAVFKKVDFKKAELRDILIGRSELTEVAFNGSVIVNSTIHSTILKDIDFSNIEEYPERETSLYKVDFNNTKLQDHSYDDIINRSKELTQ